MTISNLFEIDGLVLGKYLGYWPDGNKLLNLKSITIFLLCISLEVIPGLVFIVHNINDIARVFMCLHEFVSFLVFVSKIFVYFMNRHNLKDLIDELKTEWSLSFQEKNEKWEEIGNRKLTTLNKRTKNFYKFIGFSGIFYFTMPIFAYFIMPNDGTKEWPFPVQVYYGFEFPDHPKIYGLLLVVSIVHMFIVALVFYGVEILFVNLLNSCSLYFEYLQCKIQLLNSEMENEHFDESNLPTRFRSIIVDHEKAIGFAEKLENVINGLMLVLYSVNTFVLCFLMFEFSILINDILNFLKVLTFFLVVQVLLVLYSYFGTKLMDESEAIATAIYDLPWYRFKSYTTRRYLLLIIMRSNNSARITCGKFYPVNLQSYYDAVGKAYTYFTILKSMFN